MLSKKNIALIGNPNCGKTTLFNVLTGMRQRVGNWPGVTVERKSGLFSYDKKKWYEVIDLPGTYAIEHNSQNISQDEMLVHDYLLNESDNSVIVNVIDATNLQRSLYLTLQLLDLKLPLIIVLNMIDAVNDNGVRINVDKLAQLFGCPVVAISSTKKIGLHNLYQEINSLASRQQKPEPTISTLHETQEQILRKHLANFAPDNYINKLNRLQLLQALLNPNDFSFAEDELKALEKCRTELSDWCDGEIDVALASSRYQVIDELGKDIIEKPREANITLSDKLDKIALGKITGIPFFLLAMYFMFLVAVNFGAVFIDFFDVLFSTIFVDGLAHLLENFNAPNWIIVILANGIGTGIQTVATFVPVIGAMFFCLSFLEDSGYLARAAMVVDRGMRAIGLPGKAFVPMLVGFGCGVPAIMGTRTLESTRDRIMSICMIPFMSCGARLPVYALLTVIFFPNNAPTMVFILYLLGIFIAIITGFILKFTLLKGEVTPFIMEIPVYRMPTLKSLLILSWQRLRSFIVKAGQVIVLMVTVLSVLNSVGIDGKFSDQNTENSVLAVISKQITPVFSPMGVTDENWPATVGIFTGILAKEAVIATLNSLYSMNEEQNDDSEFSFLTGVSEAFATIPENLSGLLEAVLDPLGLAQVGEDIAALQEELEVDVSAVSEIERSFVTSSAAMAYLIFILLYTPCVAALGATYREAGAKWAIFVAVWTFAIGWICAVSYYQFSLLGITNSALWWLIGMALALILLVIMLKLIGKYTNFANLQILQTSCKQSKCSKSSCC